MSDNKPEPVASIEECDRETCREFLGEYYGTAQEFDDALLMQFAKHRTAAVAKREAEIAGMLANGTSKQIKEVVEQCPSGALTYSEAKNV